MKPLYSKQRKFMTTPYADSPGTTDVDFVTRNNNNNRGGSLREYTSLKELRSVNYSVY